MAAAEEEVEEGAHVNDSFVGRGFVVGIFALAQAPGIPTTESRPGTFDCLARFFRQGHVHTN